MKCVEFLFFVGDDVYGWFVLVERYFLSGGYDEWREIGDCFCEFFR